MRRQFVGRFGHAIGIKYHLADNALKAAKRAAGPEDLIVVTGSIFVVAEALGKVKM